MASIHHHSDDTEAKGLGVQLILAAVIFVIFGAPLGLAALAAL